MLLSCFYKSCTSSLSREPDDLKVQRAVNLLHPRRFELRLGFLMLPPVFFFFFFWKREVIMDLKPHNEPLESVGQVLILWWMLLCFYAHSWSLDAGSLSLGSRAGLSCLMPEAHPASWHQQPHWPDWDPIPNLPVALTRCHFVCVCVCWISFWRAVKANARCATCVLRCKCHGCSCSQTLRPHS